LIQINGIIAGRLQKTPAEVRADKAKAQFAIDRSAAGASPMAAGVVRLAGTQKGRKQKGHAMRTNTMSYAMALAAGALGFAGAVPIGTASPSWAAPVAPDTVRTAASNQLIDVQYHRRGYRGYGRGYGQGYGRRYYGRGYYRGGYGYPYAGYAYPYYYPYAYPSPYLGFGFGWGGW
jgi:hypothetical protein